MPSQSYRHDTELRSGHVTTPPRAADSHLTEWPGGFVNDSSSTPLLPQQVHKDSEANAQFAQYLVYVQFVWLEFLEHRAVIGRYGVLRGMALTDPFLLTDGLYPTF